MHPSISIIIVSYNSGPLTQLCLWSLAQSGLKFSEVIIIDNAVSDPYVEKLAKQYPFVRLIRNEKNEGFGRACNKGFKQASGDLILFLNPDTIVPNDFEQKITDFFNKNPQAGAMGVKMIDGLGQFLPESKRNFPYPLAALFKFTGLEKIVSPQKRKWHYYAKHLSINEPGQIEILSGAFMVVTREAMEKTGGFDPQYFLYAEDIDLSWQIIKSGFEVWYNPEITIIHLKGETTKKSPHYSSMFYKSMEQFYLKFFSNQHNKLTAFAAILLIKLISRLSAIKHRLKKDTTKYTPSAFHLHRNSCSATYQKLSAIPHPDHTFSFKQTTKANKKHLLISTNTANPNMLIDKINYCFQEKCNILLLHEQSNTLFELNGNNEHCRVIL